jgi:ABC-type multidrug transport system ATPase subunit
MKVELANVKKRFGKVQALSGLTLEIPEGRAVALVGPNGSGKSTLIRILTGLLACEGSVLYDGAPRDMEVASKMAYVPQVAPALSAPVGELLRFVCSVRDVRQEEVTDLANRLGLDLHALGRQPFKNLSGGMKQKVLLALALAVRAELYVFDEPTASLDARSREDFFRLFAERRGDATLILCSHRIEEIRHLVDHVVALQDGRVAYDGAAAPYLASSGEALIELLVTPDDVEDWLRSRGFALNASGWWGMRVARSDKMRIVREVAARLNGQLENIVVRDLERLVLDAEEEVGSG